MADWYVSSAAYALIVQFAASTAYTVGQIVRPLTTPAAGHEYCFRCTTAGTSSTEPTWPTSNNSTVTTGGATFTNISGQAAYGWSGAAGSLYCIANSASGRPVIGDVVFVSSDHSETYTNSPLYQFGSDGFGVIQFLSVNRAGNVPPQTSDLLAGAALVAASSNNIQFDPQCNNYWQGFSFTVSGTSGAIYFSSGDSKSLYFKNCQMVFSNASGSLFRFGNNGNTCKVIFDNTTMSFANTSQMFGNSSGQLEFIWINTPSAVLGTLPPAMFNESGGMLITCRGVDLSFITNTLVSGATSTGSFMKVLLDNCKIAPGVVRYTNSGSVNTPNQDEIELVNCFDGTNFLSERHNAYGDLTTDRSTTMVGGAQDNTGSFAFKLVSSGGITDLTGVGTLDTFTFDVNNTLVGASHTATVEILGGVLLNNTDILLALQYLGTSGSDVASFVNSLPTVLTPSAALPTSSAVWNNVPTVASTWNPTDAAAMTLSGGNLVATSTSSAAGVRAYLSQSSGKYYWEVTGTTWNSGGQVGIASAAANLATVAGAGVNACVVIPSGAIYNNNSSTGDTLSSLSNGNVIGCAVDLGADLFWMRVSPSGNWNGSATANPATGAGGISISAWASGVLVYPLVAASTTGAVLTANFGATGYSGAAPSGFGNWPAPTAPSPQHIQVTFTPQQAGRLRGLVRLGRPGATVWVNPQIAVT